MRKRMTYGTVGLATAMLVFAAAWTMAQQTGTPEGWCCHNAQVFGSSSRGCLAAGGDFFDLLKDAQEFCGGRGAPPGEPPPRDERPPAEESWCCRHGEVFPAPPHECEIGGGRPYGNEEEAQHFCRGGEERPGEEPPEEQSWCCRHGEVFPALPHCCPEMGGLFFPTHEEAEHHCRGEGYPLDPVPQPGGTWCCHKGQISSASESQCAARGGRFFISRADASANCAGVPDQPSIIDLKGSNWKAYVDQVVTIEGVFVADPVPMLVTDLNLVLMNMRLPIDQYIVLTGNQAQEIDPKQYGGARLRLTGRVIQVTDRLDFIREHVWLEVISLQLIDRLQPYDPQPQTMQVLPGIRQPHRWAILFSGGINAKNNHTRYWNDLKFMYTTLVNEYGFTDQTIAVLYADGKALDTDMPVHYAGTEANLQTVFNLLRQNSTSDDLVFIFTTNHGGGFYKSEPWPHLYSGQTDTSGDEGSENLKESNYGKDFNGDGDTVDVVSWDEVLNGWGAPILDDTLTTMMQGLSFDRMVVVMEQCFSAGLIGDISRSGGNIVLMSAAGEYEPSWSMPPSNNYNEFSYHFTCAINGATPTGASVNADSNGDGRVSMVEAFNYARSKDTASETPWYEDNGNGIPHSGAMPSGGEGALGSNTFLDTLQGP